MTLRRHPLGAALAGAALLRMGYFLVIWFFNPEGFWAYDSGEYWRLAENLVNHGEFSSSNGEPFLPEHFRTPLYPLFLAAIQVAGAGLYSVIILQLIISLAVVYVAFKLAFLITGQTIPSVLCAWVMVLDLPSVVMANSVLTETVFTLLVLCSLFYLIRVFLQEKKMIHLVLSAALISLAALTRPVAIYLPLFIVLLIIFYNYGSLRVRLKAATIYILIVLSVLSPWLVRNYNTLGRVFHSTAGSFILAAWHAPNVKAQKEGIPVAEARYALWTDWYYNSQWDAYHQPLQYMDYVKEKSLGILKDNPQLVLKQHISGMVHLLFKPVRGRISKQLEGKRKPETATATAKNEIADPVRTAFRKSGTAIDLLMIFQMGLLLVVYLGAIAGTVRFWRERKFLILLVLGVVIFYFINMVVPPVTGARFRVPVMPLIAILSGAGWWSLVQKWRNRSHSPAI